MKIIARFKVTALALAGSGLMLPQTTLIAADLPSPPSVASEQAIHDVALATAGLLEGQVLDGQGFPMASLAVTVWASGQLVAATQTDAEGNFVVGGLRGGIYTVVAGETSRLYRLWTENTAPPQATGRVLLVGGSDTARGQSGILGGGLFGVRSTTLALGAFLGGIIAGGTIGQQSNSLGSSS